jgi:hypothetical protein
MSYINGGGLKSDRNKMFFRKYLNDKTFSSNFNVSYKDVIVKLFSWLRFQDKHTHMRFMFLLENEIHFSYRMNQNERINSLLETLHYENVDNNPF